ncbi:uncharacterized protein [Sinocyclocheilus grahami]|uniref:uncharacterized protein isoform X2 n=1 Tax=Sinocyclocheilus grahami TaxID=75366 RepID=UPI0007ACB979|nr:PREDICTED: uncharacterized protein LOC107590656 isoform X2 [Sinocyclocheilus grahami]
MVKTGLCMKEKYMNESFDVDECCSELHHGKMDEWIAKSSLNSVLKELLDEKISTLRKNHWILGPEDLNDTLVYDFEIEEAA